MKKAKIFKNGQSEAVRLPKAFRFGANEVYIHKIGNAIVLLPKDSPWENLFQGIEQFTEDYLDDRVQLPNQKREGF